MKQQFKKSEEDVITVNTSIVYPNKMGKKVVFDGDDRILRMFTEVWEEGIDEYYDRVFVERRIYDMDGHPVEKPDGSLYIFLE